MYNLPSFCYPAKASCYQPVGISIPQKLARFSSFRSIITYAGVTLAAGLVSLALWLGGLVTSLEGAFVLVPQSKKAALTGPSFWISVLLIGSASLFGAAVVGKLEERRALRLLGIGFLALAMVSLLASWLFSVDILFAPVALAASVSAVAIQVKRLRQQELELTEKLIASSGNVELFPTDDAEHCLLSGLKLLETVLSPNEAVVFRRDGDGRLVSAARLRTDHGGSLDTSRNSVWRGGISLCERAMATGEIIVETIESEDASTNIALPLRHEDYTVGALLIRVGHEFDENDRTLLLAVGSQMARNLQREEANKASAIRNPLAFFSAKASKQRLQSLYVLNGALLAQSVGVNALSEINDGVALGYLDGRIAFANSALARLACLSRDRIRGISFFQLLDSFRTDVFDEPAIGVRRVLQTGEPYERELHFADRNETYGLRISLVFNDFSRAPKRTGSPNPPLCLALVVKDLTAIKEHEQLKSDMISLMSHELRTPLTSINGFAELLTTDEGLPEQAKEFVTIIANESQRLSRMINTFLAVTKLQRKDKQEVLKIPLRLDEVVKETIASLQPIAKKRRIRLVEQPSERLPPVAADKSMITQAVKNLVSNAIKYSPERTTVTVSTRLEAEAVRLCVEDRGYGIPAELKDRVWEKFYRVVREGQEKDEESTGLGLSFVREVVEQHGGRVDLDSEVGRGSKFSFTLPRL